LTREETCEAFFFPTVVGKKEASELNTCQSNGYTSREKEVVESKKNIGEVMPCGE